MEKSKEIIWEPNGLISIDYDRAVHANKHLQNKPALLNKLLLHELGHTPNESLVKEIWHDTTSPTPAGLWRFIITHPSSWWVFTPFRPLNRTLYFNDVMFLMWFITLILIGLVIEWIKKT